MIQLVLKLAKPAGRPTAWADIDTGRAEFSAGGSGASRLRRDFFEPCALSEAFRPPLGVPQGNSNASRYDGRDRRLGPLRWEVGRVREYITRNVAIALIVACRAAFAMVR